MVFWCRLGPSALSLWWPGPLGIILCADWLFVVADAGNGDASAGAGCSAGDGSSGGDDGASSTSDADGWGFCSDAVMSAAWDADAAILLKMPWCCLWCSSKSGWCNWCCWCWWCLSYCWCSTTASQDALVIWWLAFVVEVMVVVKVWMQTAMKMR